MNEIQENNRWRDFHFKGYCLYLKDVDTGFSVVPDLTYDGMWRVSWPDGQISADFYNMTMAKENTRTIASKYRFKGPAEGSGSDLNE